ncbi:YHS domain-containing (seleno)protein [Neptunomonas antarctica]|uniref:YHS domain-containing protein n=1 Tax=Neptunomonas antarctica TaxID=619304 RepID=A0A1N7NHC4_9GAMM|nr:YHS domain-containing protein [Neptunomonas antarctica]
MIYASQQKILYSLFISLLMLFSFKAMAKSPVYTALFSDIAVSGYDTVAYFTEGKAVKGSDDYSIEYQDTEWRFKNSDNLAIFKADPAKYAPQYGGYCAWAVANNDTAKGDPLQWTLLNGKLYLNYDADIQSKWLKDKEALIRTADQNWPGVIQ